MNFNTLGFSAQPFYAVGYSSDPGILPKWGCPTMRFRLVHYANCSGSEWPEDDVPDWMTTFPPLEEVDHDGVGRP